MFLCEQYDVTTGAITRITRETVQSLLSQPQSICWIDIEDPTEDDFAWLTQTFNFHPLALEDVRNQHQRSKLDRYDDYYFFVLRPIHYHPKSHRVDSSQLDIFVGANYLVTLRREAIPALQEVRRRWEQSRVPNEPISFLFYLITDTVVDSYFPVIDSIGDFIDDLDQELLASPGKDTLRHLFALRHSLLNIRKTLSPLRDAFNELVRAEQDDAIFPMKATRVYFGDIYDHILRLTDFVDTYRDMLSGSLDAYQSSLSNKLNENMQRLTVAATLLATSAVITGFFGMNVHGLLINAEISYSAYLVLALLLIVTAIEFWLFRRQGWI